MKKIKQLVMAVLVFVLTFSGLPVVSAETTYTIRLTGTAPGHTYEVYQIFSGDISNDNTLSNIEWGTGIQVDKAQSELGDAGAKAQTISGKSNDSAEAKAFAQELYPYLSSSPTKTVTSEEGTTTISDLASGYYLIKDQDSSLENIYSQGYTRFILQVSKDTNIAIKSGAPTLTKKVKVRDSDNYSVATDYAIGDTVYFELTATLPRNYEDFSVYEFLFFDLLPKGLTYNNDAEITLVNDWEIVDITGSFFKSITSDELSFSNRNLKSMNDVFDSSKIILRYSATVNDSAETGAKGNINTGHVIYTANPNVTDGSNRSITPGDQAKVYTYQLTVNKVKENQEALAGAGFTLYKKVNNQYTEIKKFEAGSDSTFEFKGIDAGDYKLVESSTPAGYNTMKDIEFTVTSTIDSTGALTNLTATSANATFETDVNTGIITLKVVNKQGALLPNTGGIGTTILYLVGTSLVLGAGVLFVVKKRVSTK